MSFLYDETITNFFHRISSKEKPKKMRKRKRLQEDTEAGRSFTTSDKKPKVQQKLLLSNDGQSKGNAGPSRQLTKTPTLKGGQSSKSLGHSSAATPCPVDALSRVSSKETPTTRHANPLPTPLTAKRPASAQVTRSFLIPPDTDQPTRTPRPQSPQFSAESLHSKQRKTTELPTPVTMPRRATFSRAQKSPQSRVRSLSPSRELSSPEPSQASTIYPVSSEYEESMPVEEGQRDEYYTRYKSPSPPPSLVPSSQSQADGCFDFISFLPKDSEPSTSRYSPVFLVPRLPDKVTAGLLVITDDEDRGQILSSQGKQSSSVPRSPCVDRETSLVEVHEGEEYVLSSQSQLVLPFHVSPRKNRRKVSCSSSSSPEDTTHSDEIVPSSQSQLEKELDMTSKLTDDRPHVLAVMDNRPPPVESSSQIHLAPEITAPFSSLQDLSTSTQVLVEETPEGYYDPPLEDEAPGSVTEEESGDEGDNMFSPDQSNSALTNQHESAPSPSQESMTYPSSLPDAIQEFREMFGVGDGSYPDDFPMSLRD